MGKATSFICEHTAEYVLIPKLKEILRKRFDIVTPIYYWISRENSNISRQLHKHDIFKVVGLYSRRPKLISANSQKIIVKINDQIFRAAQYGMGLGIPIIAGCPLVKNLWELGNNPNCVWIKLCLDSKESFERELEFAQSHSYVNHLSEFTFANEEDLLTYLTERSASMDFDSAISSFREIKRCSEGAWEFFRYMGGYKPVYFLLK
jgi:hypothetical protein